MNFNKTALALAVAGITAAAPIAAQADGSVYASVRIGVWSGDISGDGVDNTELRSFSSRFGVKGETDLGNGMTGFGKYEWDVDFNRDSRAGRTNEDDIGIRQRIVGVKGDFGKITLGQTYHTFYNYVVGPTDIPWWFSGYTMISYRGRTDDAISYDYSSGAFNFGVSAYFIADANVPADSEDAVDQLEVGASFGIGDTTLAVAIQTTEADLAAGTGTLIGLASDEDILGLAWTGIMLGGSSWGFGLQTQDEDMSFLVDVVIGNAYVHVEAESLDAASKGNTLGDRDRLGITLGYTQTLGKDTKIYYEFHTLDEDTGNSNDDKTAVMAVLYYNLL